MILAFLFVVYTTSERIGSPARMYELLQEASLRNPVAGNAGGSYLTMRSVSGIIFGVINLCGELLFFAASVCIWFLS
jgi:Na+/proline symporter